MEAGMEDEEPTPEVAAWEKLDGWDRTLGQVFALYFTPEIERRWAVGSLPQPFSLYMAQLLLPPDGEHRVLLNDEVQGEALMRAPREIAKGERALVSDLEHIERFELPDALLDNGHFTIVRSGEGWRMFFNFLSGRAKARDMLDLASQFLEAAIGSKAKGHAGPAVDNLFSASELVSKAELILHRSKAVTSRNHKAIASEINAWAKLGNIDIAFVALFNKLGQQRPNARYSDRDHRPPAPEDDSFELVRAMIDRGLERVGKATGPEFPAAPVAAP
jgi:hypothetical protein